MYYARLKYLQIEIQYVHIRDSRIPGNWKISRLETRPKKVETSREFPGSLEKNKHKNTLIKTH